MESKGVWYKSKKGWVSTLLGLIYFVLDHWSRAEAAHAIYKVLTPAVRLFPLISPWIPLVLFSCALVFFEIERRKHPNLVQRIPPIYQPPVVQPTTEPAKSGKRKIVDVTPEYLTGLFARGQTTIQAKKLAEAFIGKWMKVSGSLGDVLGSTDLHRQVSFAGRSMYTHDCIYMYFTKEWFDELSTLKRGDNITVIGKITEVDGQGVQLDLCEIVDT